MGAVVLLLVVFLLDLCETKGSSTVIPLFVQTGTDLLLDVKEPVTLDKKSDFTWKYNVSENIVKVSGNNEPIIYEEHRTQFFAQNYSLLLKNVQQKHNGLYKAQISAKKDKTVAEYKVIVEDPVSAVNLTVNCSSAPNLTVTCSTVDSGISSTFRCDNQTCSRERSDPTTYPSSIDVYLDKRLIICNHSNHVSWEQKKKIKSVCEPSGSSAVTPVSVKKGDDLLLNVMNADNLEDFVVVWNFNKTDVLVRFSPGGEPLVSAAYTGRVEFPVKKFSVKLKNLQEADSGVYTARATDEVGHTLAEYDVTVQGPYPSPMIYVVVVILVLAGIGFFALRHLQQRRNKRENIENTTYAVPDALLQGGHSPHEMGAPAQTTTTNDASDPSPVSEYSLVDRHSESKGSTETRGNTLPESVYDEILSVGEL